MTKRKSQAPSGKRTTRRRKSPASRGKMELTNQNIRMAVTDLEITQPIRLVRVVGNRLELHLPWSVVKWPETAAEKKKRLAAKPKPKEPDPSGEPDGWHRAQEE